MNEIKQSTEHSIKSEFVRLAPERKDPGVICPICQGTGESAHDGDGGKCPNCHINPGFVKPPQTYPPREADEKGTLTITIKSPTADVLRIKVEDGIAPFDHLRDCIIHGNISIEGAAALTQALKQLLDWRQIQVNIESTKAALAPLSKEEHEEIRRKLKEDK